MTVNKLIEKLLKLKGLRVTGFEFSIRNTVLNLWVKPQKNGCLCPHCNRRGGIVHIERMCPGCGVIFLCVVVPFYSGIVQERFNVPPMAECKRISLGLKVMPA